MNVLKYLPLSVFLLVDTALLRNSQWTSGDVQWC